MNMSEQITDLAAALVAFQGEVTNPKKTAKNPHHQSTYAPLDEVMNTVKPALTKHGLMVIQNTGTEGELITITTKLIHKSGQWLETDVLKLPGSMKGRNEFSAQALGSAISYGRRYQLSAMLGIASEEDDDANGAQGQPAAGAARQGSQSRKPDPKPADKPKDAPAGQNGPHSMQTDDGKVKDMGKPVSSAQIGKIKTMIGKVAELAGKPHDEVDKAIKEHYKYQATSDLTAAVASRVIDTLEKWERQAKDSKTG